MTPPPDEEPRDSEVPPTGRAPVPAGRRRPRRATGGTAPDATEVPTEWARSADDVEGREGDRGNDERLLRDVPPHW